MKSQNKKFITESTIKQVNDLDIKEVVESEISLKNKKAPCPFHNEKQPVLLLILQKIFLSALAVGKAVTVSHS
ncbi:MAG: hypothetical protein IPP81_20315 [Chitinophagaceae bacterium]|nr:hypothetical protein [Chitinophagaceae bacterium]